ncbi:MULTISPECIES: hypothetical protein [unclassified Mesorhizobium]|uniref:hypothetical protein n=1 Tax=unclassified Mesorhizobium TaxID=325217 RepID=UPI00112B9E82|nr:MULTISPECIES: hypothetical protein [unclassified Mesorhizobium]MBZ9993605.1 hypothetical protein [Mesorhizobium sp. BH1-1-4]TPL94952.1 hypothetical protein FJ948_00555 [Mesorhizobium sp. B2-3-12]
MSEAELLKKIERQIQEDFNADPQMSYERQGLTASLRRGVGICAVAMAIMLVGLRMVGHLSLRRPRHPEQPG